MKSYCTRQACIRSSWRKGQGLMARAVGIQHDVPKNTKLVTMGRCAWGRVRLSWDQELSTHHLQSSPCQDGSSIYSRQRKTFGRRRVTTWPLWAWESEREGKKRATNSLTKCLCLFAWPSLVTGRTQGMKKVCALVLILRYQGNKSCGDLWVTPHIQCGT